MDRKYNITIKKPKQNKLKTIDKFTAKGFNSQLGPLTRSVALPTEMRGTCLKSNPNFKFTSKMCTDQLQRHGEIKVCRLTFVVVIDYQPSQFIVSKFQSVS